MTDQTEVRLPPLPKAEPLGMIVYCGKDMQDYARLAVMEERALIDAMKIAWAEQLKAAGCGLGFAEKCVAETVEKLRAAIRNGKEP